MDPEQNSVELLTVQELIARKLDNLPTEASKLLRIIAVGGQAMQFDEISSLVLDQDGVVRKFKLEGMTDEDAELDDHPLAQLDAQFVVVTGTVQKLVLALKRQLGGYA